MKKTRIIAIIIMFALLLAPIVTTKNADAKASKAAMKVLKGDWITVGNSQGTRVVFTQTKVKFYNLWNDDYTKKSKKGTYTGSNTIISTKKKGKQWYIKVKGNNGIYYYVGKKDGLTCQWKENGEWQYSFSSSLSRR